MNGEKYESFINDMLEVKMKDIDNKFAIISVQVQVQDFAGNKSTIVKINHPHYKDKSKEKPAPAPTPAPARKKTPEGGSGNSKGGGATSEQSVLVLLKIPIGNF